MAEKLAIGEALNETFQFALSRWGSVLRFGWAPMALAVLISAGIVWSVLDMAALKAAAGNPEVVIQPETWLRTSLAMALFAAVAGSLLISFILSGFMASVFRLAALGEERPGFVHLRFDGPARRVFLASLILSLINLALYAAAFLIASATTGITPGAAFGASSEFFRLVSEAASASGQAPPEAINEAITPFGLFFIAFLYAALPMIYINIRLAPFLAGSAAENRLLLFGALRLTAGNFWGVFLYYFLLSIVMALLVFVFQIVMGVVEALTALPPNGAFAIVSALASAVGMLATIAYQVFAYAIQFSGQGVIYRRLKTGA